MMFNSLKMDAAALFTALSPSKTCKVRVSSTRYRNDPYRARVAQFIKPATPMFNGRKFTAPAALVPADVMLTNAATAPTVPPSPAQRTVTKSFSAVTATSKAAAAPGVARQKTTEKPTGKPQLHFAVVGFKHETGTYQAPFRVSAGDVVFVEADRGEHIGVVQSVTTVKPKFNVPSSILRRAVAADSNLIDDLTAKEDRTTVAVQKLAESVGLGIQIVDTEFQADENKMTVFFASKSFVDFRKLQRSLFREFRCRIWFVYWREVRRYTPVEVNPIVA